jgi:GntR family transcriptional regulator / MocR family aminotransferase
MVRSTGADTRSGFPGVDETSQPIELLLSVTREGPETLGSQIEDQLRRAIREGALRPGSRVPSTRDLARQLGVSRRITVDAYAQLAAEGYLLLKQGARPKVSNATALAEVGDGEPDHPAPPARFSFRPSVPDVSTFPRAAWLRSIREALATMTDLDFTYGDPRGVDSLRAALADYLGRVRGVVAEPGRVVVTCGYTQGQDLVLHALAASGAKRAALEDPGDPDQQLAAERAGLEAVPIGVDELGIRVDELDGSGAEVVLLTPAHQHPTGVVLAPERRAALLAWLREHDAIAIEDDYDAEYRYDRAAVGALQGLDPDRVVYAGSASKTLAPALRIGWLVVPRALVDAISHQKVLSDRGTARIEQQAFADFLARGELDRHLRRMRGRYRARRDRLLDALAEELPEANIRGIAAGLHATVELPDGPDEKAILEQTRERRIEITVMGEYRHTPRPGPPTLLLGYASTPEPAIRPGVRAIAEAVRAAAG